MNPELFSLLSLGFMLGMMHALDADHVMAVSVLSVGRPSLGRTLRFSANWAIGHGGVLLCSGIVLFGLGLAIPETLQRLAEIGVGVVLIALGLWCFWNFRQRRLSLEQHSHGKMVHRHWHQSGDETHRGHGRGGHAPIMVGMLHGLAGSAPAMALIPAMAQGQMEAAFGYLMVFSLGVMLSMVAFGLGWGSLLQRLNERLLDWSRRLVAASSIIIGGYWLSQAV
jgi:cytochrome c biogenesis protein CcdA